MSYISFHYIPVLKLKRAEKAALALVSEEYKAAVTPFFEVVERGDKHLDQHLDTAFTGLRFALTGYTRCFLDPREVIAGDPTNFTNVFDRAKAECITFTPVISIADLEFTSEAMSYGDGTVALRIDRNYLESKSSCEEILSDIKGFGLNPINTDLFVDIGSIDEMILPGFRALSESVLSKFPELLSWKSFTLTASSFPKSMGLVVRNSHCITERIEWNSWLNASREVTAPDDRSPTYSDCGIQHPIGVEGFDPRTMQVSATIRYTLSDGWLLIKGQSTKAVPAKLQFPMLARKLVSGELAEYYYGVDHCAGCRLMEHAAEGAPNLGSAEVWRKLGTVHHITVVAQALERLRDA